MNLRLKKLTIENFRGISKAEVTFDEFNFLVGDNGTGKTTLVAAIARLIPALRQEDRIFLDADFSFNSLDNAERIKLIYDVEINHDGDSSNNLTIELVGERQNIGISRSHLNDQQVAKTSIIFSNNENTEKLLTSSKDEGILKQRVIRNGWGGGRIAPIWLPNDGQQRHAATHEREESGNFDNLRARLVQLLGKTELGVIVNNEYPDLLDSTLRFTNDFLGETRFKDIHIGYSEQLTLERAEGLIQPWDGLSSGEQSAFNLAMAIEFEKRNSSQILIIEEPECGLHPVIQRDFYKYIHTHLPNRQVFISTHSPYIFENHLYNANLIITKKINKKITIASTNDKFGLFSQVSWGELSYYAYDLPVFEFHNELYGWIQERTNSMKESQIENYLTTQHNVAKNKNWIKADKNNQAQPSSPVTIMTYIRNFTHHPENKFNQSYTKTELSVSIKKMIDIVNSIKNVP